MSFVAIPPSEVEEAWTASIDTVEAFSKSGARGGQQAFQSASANMTRLTGIFCRQKSRASKGSAEAAEDLERWTAALGFCDLVSLYLLSGLRGPEDFPLPIPLRPRRRPRPG